MIFRDKLVQILIVLYFALNFTCELLVKQWARNLLKIDIFVYANGFAIFGDALVIYTACSKKKNNVG